VSAVGVYANSSSRELKFFFIGLEPTEVETGDAQHPKAEIKEAAHIQAEVTVNRDLAMWIRDFLNAYLAEPQEAAHQ
jgi:hypothetical protein